MPLTLLSQALVANSLKNVCLVATDMDSTLTQNGKFTPTLLQALEQLAAAEIQVLIVTGRSAGWVGGLVNYLPTWGAIAENGGMFYASQTETPIALVTIPDLALHRQKLAQTFQRLQADFPQLQESADNRFRVTDWTFDIQRLSLPDIQAINAYCQDQGWGFTYSNVQGHIKPIEQDKATGLRQVLGQYFPEHTAQQVVTVGDSPNDESLFDADQFPLSVGVANVKHYADQLVHQPTYITPEPEGKGFCQLADWLCGH
ncbi:HAD family hydrolase [Trichocoleus sp. FACHB-262]|uniref:HAD family hydrolase n=1 Tax=Trichocoleus sp. FACHB-262 TaxID=2692869 RepID=UPI001683EF44|nr:HAD family hydrolase [Trichocoleus sp. FACHB-262]MBD2123451.1 HAD family phosphatase [Trichocoleus sp. FACHB-262]